jgi:phage tail sheath protein FI
VRDYARALYVMDIPTYTDSGARIFDATVQPDVNYTIQQFAGRSIDNRYVATYFPDVNLVDSTSGRRVRVPASVAALSALAQNDRLAFPWYAPAGFNRASLTDVTGLATRLNSADRDSLYDARINPITSFPGAGFVIFGQKTLQISRSALDRVNVMRMLIELAGRVSKIGLQYAFEQNTASTRARFVSQLTPELTLIQSQSGIDSFSITMDETNNTQTDIEQNKLNGRIVIVPTRAVEYIAVDFVITNSGVEFV